MRLAQTRNALCHLGMVASLALVSLPATALTQVLYDAAVQPTVAPPGQGWLGSGFFGMTQTISAAGTELIPTGSLPNNTFGGFSNRLAPISFPPFQVHAGALVNPAFPLLLRDAGYSLTLGFRVRSESHSSNDRAGFSITLIGNDLQGIELGFQAGSIFAQAAAPSLFVAAENNMSTAVTSLLADYRVWQLDVLGGGYVLSQGGKAVLSGALRDYSSYSGFGEDAYRTKNFLFLGDNTSSAQATFGISYAAITTAVPEPSAYALLLAGLALTGWLGLTRRVAPRVSPPDTGHLPD